MLSLKNRVSMDQLEVKPVFEDFGPNSGAWLDHFDLEWPKGHITKVDRI